MKNIVVASSSRNMISKIDRVLLPLTSHEAYHCKSAAELYAACDRLGGGVVIVSALRDASLNEIKNTLPFDWDIVAILPSGAPAPFYSSNLTVLTTPVSARDLISAVENLLNVTQYRRTEYEKEKADMISKAKLVIMKQNNIGEEQAHYLLQKMSMDKGVPIKSLAEKIVSKGI